MDVIFRWSAILICSAAIGSAVGAFVTVRPLKPPSTGPAGEARAHALSKYAVLALAEPALLILGAWISFVFPKKYVKSLSKNLAMAGYVFGLTAYEYVVVCLLVGLSAGVAGSLYSMSTDEFSVAYGPLFFVLGIAWMSLWLQGRVEKRHEAVFRSLPALINLLNLSLSAGQDFGGALRAAARVMAGEKVLHQEVVAMLRMVDLGHTRRHALEAFAKRVPTEAVQDFVSGVVLAEEKGTPLAEALDIQATILRDKRSAAAEDLIAKVRARLVRPFLLVQLSMLILMLGVATGMSSRLGDLGAMGQ